MSNESNPSASARRTDEPATADREAAAVRAAIERMQEAAVGDRGTYERLRGGLADLAQAVARAKADAKAGTFEHEAKTGGKAIGPLLDDFEARVAGLIALLDVPQNAGEQRADTQEPREVPTVSHVVSQLGREDAMPQAPPDARPAAAGDAPSVTALGAMLEALAASMLNEAAAQPAAPAKAVPAPVPVPEPEAIAQPSGPAPPAPSAAVLPDVDLLINFARMEETPYLPAEVGTAVIFDKPQVGESREPAPATPEGIQADAMAPAPADAAAVPAEAQAEPARAEPADSEPAAFLFDEPAQAPAGTPETEPADFLLEPLPATPAPRASPESDPEPAAASPAPGPAPPPQSAAYDPLAPVRALSDAEKIALFS